MSSFRIESKSSYQPKVALVHDDFLQAGGAESLFATIASLFPQAPIYTSLVDWTKLPPSISRERIKTSFMQKIPFAKYLHKALLVLYPLAFEGFDFEGFDLVISSTTRFANSIITKPHTLHISYVNSIPRFLWDRKIQKDYLPPALRFLLSPLLMWLKRWDRVTSSRVDFYIANSQNIARKIKKAYGRESTVVHPFANTNFFTPAKIHNWGLREQNYYLVVTRLVKWKKIDIVIEATQDLDLNLKIVGTGPDEARLKRIACSKKIEFLGKTIVEQLRDLYRNCLALVVIQEEDFGIAAVEVQSCGRPAVVLASSGAKETILSGETGLIFQKQDVQSLKDAITRASKVKWSVSQIRRNALQYSKAIFVKNLISAVDSYVQERYRS